MNSETKNQRFKRLAKQRGERVLRDIDLVGNLSNRNNYEYTDQEVRAVFGPLEEALKEARQSFNKSNKKRSINL